MSEIAYSIKINGLTKPQLMQLMSYINHFDNAANKGLHFDNDTNKRSYYYGKRHQWHKRHDAIMDKIVPQLERICWNNFVKISRCKK